VSELLVLGISHKTAPVALRERLALSGEAPGELCRELVADAAIDEAVAISTCNRTEVYLVVGDPVAAESHLLGSIAARAGIRPTEIADALYAPRNCDAARHLFRVVSGLESMIVGEAEVQGQVKRAYEAALAAGTTGPMTNRLFTAALHTGGRVRSETQLGAARLSVASVAVELAREAVGELAERSVVIIGAGETAELTAQALHAHGVRTVFVANRHADRARSIAARFDGEVSSLHDLPERIAQADVVVSSTASPHTLIHAEDLAVVMEGRPDRPLVMIDIAVPRDLDPACGDVPGVRLYDIDGLSATVSRNLEVREGERAAAEALVEDEIQRFARWMGQLDVQPTIAELRRHGDEVVARVLAENAGRWETLSPRDEVRLEAVARAVMQRLLHEPTIRLKGADHQTGHARLQMARELFGLDGAAEHEAADREQDAPADVRPLRARRAAR
jgi:glutamyl-tRNA reductase